MGKDARIDDRYTGAGDMSSAPPSESPDKSQHPSMPTAAGAGPWPQPPNGRREDEKAKAGQRWRRSPAPSPEPQQQAAGVDECEAAVRELRLGG